MAFGYFWYVAAVYAAHPKAAYHLSEVIEAHAHATCPSRADVLGARRARPRGMPIPRRHGSSSIRYSAFLAKNELELRRQPVLKACLTVIVSVGRDGDKRRLLRIDAALLSLGGELLLLLASGVAAGG